MPAFSPQALLERLRALPPVSGYCVAYSGGLDSHCLLHASAALRGQLSLPLRALHVHHGLLPQADAWTRHCDSVCRALGVPLSVHRVSVAAGPAESPEEAARRARYQVFGEQLQPGECLLLAHHLDDQAETLLQRLLRGAGIRGLAAMPARRPLAAGLLSRPLLTFSRRDLADYATREGLAWVEDPSNADPALDRNLLRAEILPRLRQRWPDAGARLAASAGHAAEAEELLEELAAADLAICGDPTPAVAAVAALSAARQRNLLRYWIRRSGRRPPSQARLEAGRAALLGAGDDRQPALDWAEGRIRRYRGRLYLSAPTAVEPVQLCWAPPEPLSLPLGRLRAEPVLGGGLSRRRLQGQRITVRTRVGGERLRPVGRAHRKSLKKLLQEVGVPPWERAGLPLVYVGEELAAVADLWVVEGFQAGSGESGWRLLWERPESSIGSD